MRKLKGEVKRAAYRGPRNPSKRPSEARVLAKTRKNPSTASIALPRRNRCENRRETGSQGWDVWLPSVDISGLGGNFAETVRVGSLCMDEMILGDDFDDLSSMDSDTLERLGEDIARSRFGMDTFAAATVRQPFSGKPSPEFIAGDSTDSGPTLDGAHYHSVSGTGVTPCCVEETVQPARGTVTQSRSSQTLGSEKRTPRPYQAVLQPAGTPNSCLPLTVAGGHGGDIQALRECRNKSMTISYILTTPTSTPSKHDKCSAGLDDGLGSSKLIKDQNPMTQCTSHLASPMSERSAKLGSRSSNSYSDGRGEMSDWTKRAAFGDIEVRIPTAAAIITL